MGQELLKGNIASLSALHLHSAQQMETAHKGWTIGENLLDTSGRLFFRMEHDKPMIIKMENWNWERMSLKESLHLMGSKNISKTLQKKQWIFHSMGFGE